MEVKRFRQVVPLGDPVDYVLVEQNSIGWVVDPATGARQAMRLRATNAGSIAVGDLHFEVRDGANEDDLTLPPPTLASRKATARAVGARRSVDLADLIEAGRRVEKE